LYGIDINVKGPTHLQVSTSGEHASAVYWLERVAMERRARLGEDWRLGGGKERGQGFRDRKWCLRAIAKRAYCVSCEGKKRHRQDG
jgi:hypothetical protein